jgi:hypothetical protein
MQNRNSPNARDSQTTRFPSAPNAPWGWPRPNRGLSHCPAVKDARAFVSQRFGSVISLFATHFLSQLGRLQDVSPVSFVRNQFEEVGAR